MSTANPESASDRDAATYLRVEGVNLSAFVFDTRDLSTNRGGSLMLLNAVDEAIDALGMKDGDPKILSRGASSGLFRIEGDAETAATTADNVRKALATKFPHATFVVDVVTADFADSREQLLAANRWRQMQAATLAVPVVSEGRRWSQPACELDGLRPAEEGRNGSHTLRGKKLSESTWRRREYGREEKQGFYERATDLANLPAFANDFETIAVGSKPLDGKIAVFYADGNGFGGIQAKHCPDEAKQKKWDALVREGRKGFLTAFLRDQAGVGNGRTLATDSLWRGQQTGEKDNGKECVRFETLLWGGDEFLFVMPAALGWSFATFFFEQMQGMEFAKQQLTHAAALVFCQHHSPIHRLQKLAKDQMAEFAKGAKDENGTVVGRSRDSLTVVALESFDHLGTDFEKAMNLHYSDFQPLEKMLFAKRGDDLPLYKDLAAFASGVDALRSSETFPRSQLRGLVNEMLAKKDRTIGDFQQQTDKNGNPLPPRHFRNADDEARARLADLRSLFPDPTTLWLQLEELWDYART